MKYSSPYKVIVLIIISLFTHTGISFSSPSGGNVSHGDANINQSGGNTIVNQNSDKAIINWGSFDIANGESVIFNQKNSNSIVLNRVTGGTQSFINGSLSANGKVFILNSSGILIGGGASINTGSFLASTGKMSDKDFMNGNYNIHSAFGDITNNGSIIVDNYGYAALLGRKVINNGVISANLGRVEIASGEAFRVSFYDNSLIGVSIEKGIAESYISNTGKITAEGGTIYMSAKGLSDIIKSTVNNEGVIYAGSISNDGGRVVLSAELGMVNNNSLIDVSADVGIAGNVEIYGNDIIVESKDAVIDASGESGGNVYLKASKNAEVKDKATITASGTSGNGGGVSVLSKGVVFFDKGASLFSQSVTGNGGFIEVSSVDTLHLKGTANALSTSGEHGTFKLDVHNLVITDRVLPSRSLITSITIGEINAMLGTTPNNFILSAVNISMDPSAYGVAIIADGSTGGVGDLTFDASNSINLVSPNIDVAVFTLKAVNDINISVAGAATVTPPTIKAATFNLTSSLGNSKSVGVNLDITNLRISSPEGSTDLDSFISIVPMNVSGMVGKDLKLASVIDGFTINIDDALTAVNSMSFTLTGLNTEIDSLLNTVVTKELTLDMPNGTANLNDTSFEILSADIFHLFVSNSSIGFTPPGSFESPLIVIKSLKVSSVFTYKQTSSADVRIDKVVYQTVAGVTPATLDFALSRGKLTFPFDAALHYFDQLVVDEASAIIFKAEKDAILNPSGSIDLSGGTTGTGRTGTDFFDKFGNATNSGSAKLLSFEAVGDVTILINKRANNASMNMVSEDGAVSSSCSATNFCKMASISAEAKNDITIDKFGSLSYSAKSKGGNIVINMSPIGGTGAAGDAAPAVTFTNLETSAGGTITLTAANNSIVPKAPINILNISTGSGGLVLDLLNTPLLNIISESTKDLDIRFIGGNNKFSSFSVVSDGSINFIDAFDFTPMEFLFLSSNFGDISLSNSDVFTTTSISLSGNNITSSTGLLLNLSTGSGVAGEDEFIDINMHGENEAEFNIAVVNKGILNLDGNVKVNIHSPTTIGQINGSPTSMTGNIVVNSIGGGHELTLKGNATVDSFLAEGVGNVILDPSFQAIATGEFGINSTGKITSAKGTEGEKARIEADHISLIAKTIGGIAGGVSVLPTPENYTDSAIMVEANTGYFEATTTTGPAIIDIGSDDFMSSLFKYQFFPTPAVDTMAFINGLNINSSWYDDLNNSRNDYYLYNPDLRNSRYLEYDIYDEILTLGDDLIVSDIVYKKFIHAKFKVGNSIFLK